MTNILYRYFPFITLLVVTIMGSTNISLYGKTLGELVTLQFIVIFAFKLANPNANFGKGVLLFIVSIINDALQGLTLGTSGLLYFTIFAVATFQAGIKLRNLFLSEWVAFIFAVTCCYIILYLIETIFYLKGDMNKNYIRTKDHYLQYFVRCFAAIPLYLNHHIQYLLLAKYIHL